MNKLITLLALAALSTATWSQELKLQNEKSSCIIEGTSTLHDWTMDAEQMTGKASIEMAEGKIKGIQKLLFEVKVESLKSHKSGMDKNAYKALKSEDFPTIEYEFVRVISITDQGSGQLIKTGGKLTIAGVTKSVYLDVIAKGTSFEGSTTFKMTDYNVVPPVALMGSIKTGDEITIKFNATYGN